ncbi:MAG TPA: MMPL family transporter, partial [Chitinophagaceae bacterium]|nr:MMPL family transporter [Chitinophagaceae bacterium]
MWLRLGKFILKNRVVLILILGVLTAIMSFWGSKMQISYDFSRAIPTDNPKYKAYQEFRKKFGEDGNLLVIGIQTDQLFQVELFNNYVSLLDSLKRVKGVEDILAMPSSVNLVKDSLSENLYAERIFPEKELSQPEIDSSRAIFLNLPFYRGLLYNPATHSWLMGVRINKEILNKKSRNEVVGEIRTLAENFGTANNLEVHLSGLPLIRTDMAVRVANEMKWFLVASVVLSAIILLLFFRSFSSTLISLSVVIIGVMWSLGTMYLMGYKITLLTALIPPLLVVIGIPNCIYFLNKYHTAYNDTRNGSGDKKREALVTMVGRMGIVTLFCNLTAAIGFAVFALTRSQILKEFGIVAGINIMVLFFISLILIPVVLSYLPA